MRQTLIRPNARRLEQVQAIGWSRYATPRLGRSYEALSVGATGWDLSQLVVYYTQLSGDLRI